MGKLLRADEYAKPAECHAINKIAYFSVFSTSDMVRQKTGRFFGHLKNGILTVVNII